MFQRKRTFIIVFLLFTNLCGINAQPKYVTLKEASTMHSDSVIAIRLVEGDNPAELLSYDRLHFLFCDGVKSFPYPFPQLSIRSLYLSEFSTVILPKFIYQFGALTELIIEDQVLTTLTSELRGFNELHQLTLITPNLTTIEKEALFLGELSVFLLDTRRINLTSEQVQMPEIINLFLYGDVVSFPKFDSFPQLKVLHLHNGQATKIDPSVFYILSLEEFHTCNPIIELNEGIGNLKELNKLSLCSHQNHPTFSNPITIESNFPYLRLSPVIGTFPQLTSLPETICSMQKLTTLDLHGSGIQSLPACLWEMKSLKFISITDTKLEQLPFVFFTSERDLGSLNIRISKPNHLDKTSKKALKKIPTNESIKRKKGIFRRTFLLTKVFGQA